MNELASNQVILEDERRLNQKFIKEAVEEWNEEFKDTIDLADYCGFYLYYRWILYRMEN